MKHTSDKVEVRAFDGDKWPDRRLSIGFTDGGECVCISPRLKTDREEFERLAACFNACIGIENPEDLRRQRDELMDVLEVARETAKFEKHPFRNWHKTADELLAKCKGAA